ncbi:MULTISPECIES: hypothetical protein [Aquimarina]|uniref:Histidine kinase N-terminal 7TM region domain-containing protein n=1 Tax=Aquimarina algiphila TaxID=2047982 RepID=A0A554VEF9_9FLAO|nr:MULTISPECIES: hypothetical protein [Aquimarina]TSE05399.1 hypothetical protein FOF46_22815 [Aquimarina algiphila]
MSDITEFYSLAHICISLIGGILLLAIWYNIRKRFKQFLEEDDSQKRIDKGLLYLSLALFIWVFSGTWIYLGNLLSFDTTIIFDVGYSFFSVLNTLALLLALFYFDFAPRFLYKNRKNTIVLTILIIAVSTVTFFLIQGYKDNPVVNGIRISGIPDLILSCFLMYLLIVSFYKTFMNRDLKLVAIISVLAFLLMLVSQMPDVFVVMDDILYGHLIKIIAKTTFISIFLVLATSWVIQLALTPKPSEMTIKFMDWSLVKMTIPSKEIYDKTIDFGSKTTQYKNLLKFAVKRKYEIGDGQYLLVNSGGEIKSQTYLSRIIENINSILQLESISQLERKDLFTFMGQGKYRLRVIPENISIDETLLEEFNKTC